MSLVSPALAGGSLPLYHLGSPPLLLDLPIHPGKATDQVKPDSPLSWETL